MHARLHRARLPDEEQEAGMSDAGVEVLASVSAPVRGPSGRVIAAVSISGPIERLTRQPGRLHAEVVCNAARVLTEALRKTND